MALRMSAKRYSALMRALSRATDEWDAEAAGEEQYGEGPSTPESRRLRADIEAVTEARAILHARYAPKPPKENP